MKSIDLNSEKSSRISIFSDIWDAYDSAFEVLEKTGKARRPVIPEECIQNAHMYYLLFADLEKRNSVISDLREREISSVFHYVPLHSSPAGLRYARISGDMSVTDSVADRLLRLPMWYELMEQQKQVIKSVMEIA